MRNQTSNRPPANSVNQIQSLGNESPSRAIGHVAGLIAFLVVLVIGAQRALAINTAGCGVGPINFHQENLTAIEWTSTMLEYEGNPGAGFLLRLDFHFVEMVGSSGSPAFTTAIQNVYHVFDDDYVGIPSAVPGLNLYWSSLLPGLQDGVQLDADPLAFPYFGRVFENVDGIGDVGNNIYNRTILGVPSPADPIVVTWSVERFGIVTDPAGQFTRGLSGEWLPLTGTFAMWECKATIDGALRSIATYYLPIEYCEYIDPTAPLNFGQEHFELNGGGLDSRRTNVRYSDIQVSDGSQWYPLEQWTIVSRIDDELGNNDNRFGWYSDGEALYSVCGDESYVTGASREPGTLLLIGDAASCIGPDIPALCDADCNGNGVGDACDIADGTSMDCNGNSLPDECELGSYAMLELKDAFCVVPEVNDLRYERYGDNRTGAVPGTVDIADLSFAGTLSLGAGSAVFAGPTHKDAAHFYPYVQYESARDFVWVHPGSNGSSGAASAGACVAYDVTSTGEYHIQGQFARANDFRYAGNGVDVVVFVNTDITAPLFGASISSDHEVNADDPFDGTGVVTFDMTTALSVGDTLRFVTFVGPPGSTFDGGFDATALRFTLRTDRDQDDNGVPDQCDAHDIFWGNPAGGSFHDPNNWDGGVMPDANDRAFIMTGGTFTVDFTADAATDWLLAGGDGDYTFDLGGYTYSVLGPTSTPFDLADATLTLNNGTLDASPSHGVLCMPADSTATLVVEGASLLLNSAVIAGGTGSLATATVNGSGSTWAVSGPLTVGDSGNGAVAILNGGSLSTDWCRVGGNEGAEGSLAVSGGGSTWTYGDFTDVGFHGNGTLTVSAGGQVSGQEGFIGSQETSVGTATVTGAGSTWTSSEYMCVGVMGEGHLDILDGGTVSAEWSRIGDWPTSVGEVTVDGAGSTWLHSTTMEIGTAGQGTLNIQNGGSVSNGWGIIANAAGSIGHVNVTGPGSNWTRTGPLHVGRVGEGTLTISNAGAVSGTWASVGDETTGVGTVTVSGAGSTWTNTGSVSIGAAGSGALTIESGGTVTAGLCRLGESAGSEGHVTVTGAGSTVTNTTEGAWSYIGNYGSGSLTVSDGGRWECPLLAISTFGTVSGNGTIEGDVSSVGLVEPGPLASTLTVEGNYDQYPGGTLRVELGGTQPGEFDKLVITGDSLLAGTLELFLLDGFDPQLGDSFEILTAASILDKFSTITGWDLGGGKIMYVDYSTTAATVRVDTVAGLDIVPAQAEIYLGFPLQLVAEAQLAVGGMTDVTWIAQWSSDDPAIASVDATGEVRGEAAGNTTIRASFGGFDAASPVEVMSLPGGTLATERVSISTASVQGDDASFGALDISAADGRFVTFYSLATNLVAGDTNGFNDVFVRDLDAGVTVRVSVDSSGSEADGHSFDPRISADGRFVTFYSYATNLVAGDTNATYDVFVHDRDTDDNGVFDELGGIKTVRVSVDSSGLAGDGPSYRPRISAGGRFVTFYSYATNLVAGDTNGAIDVFVHDRDADGNTVFDEPGGISTVRVSVDSTGAEPNGNSTYPNISADGRFVVFHSYATNLVAGDTNGAIDVFVHDRDVDDNGIFDEPGGIETTRVSVDSGGAEGDAASSYGYISGDGGMVAFLSNATNLIAEDTNPFRDVFVHDRQTGETRCVSVSSTGEQGTGDTGSASISADGRFVGFRSAADSLVPDDTNGESDVFRHDLVTGRTVRTSVSFSGGQSNGGSMWTALTEDGRTIVFQSDATNLVPFDTNAASDIFVRYDWPGDLDCDGDIDIDDVAPFVQALIDPDGYAAAFPGCHLDKADMDGDGNVNGNDIGAFIELLLDQ
ncbi:MAG: Ig-like domain-containing protein [Planctomycetota bacterium]